MTGIRFAIKAQYLRPLLRCSVLKDVKPPNKDKHARPHTHNNKHYTLLTNTRNYLPSVGGFTDHNVSTANTSNDSDETIGDDTK